MLLINPVLYCHSDIVSLDHIQKHVFCPSLFQVCGLPALSFQIPDLVLIQTVLRSISKAEMHQNQPLVFQNCKLFVPVGPISAGGLAFI